MIGERTNVGFAKFAKLIKENKYEEAVAVARQQVENGANIIDICMDEGMIDGVAAMTRFAISSAARWVAKVPFMVDSSKWGSYRGPEMSPGQKASLIRSRSRKEAVRAKHAKVLKYGAVGRRDGI